MASCKPGDRINCRIVAGAIINAYQSYQEHEETKTLEIVALDDFGYYLFVPQYVWVQNSVIIDHSRCRRLNIDPRFLGEQMCHIVEGMVSSVVAKLDGMCCAQCQEFVPMGAPNQEDKTSFICFSCRANPYR